MKCYNEIIPDDDSIFWESEKIKLCCQSDDNSQELDLFHLKTGKIWP